MALSSNMFDLDDLFSLIIGCVVQTNNRNEGPSRLAFPTTSINTACYIIQRTEPLLSM